VADPLAEGWYDHDWDTLAEIELLKRSKLTAGATVFDLGAHQAIVAMMLAKEVLPGGKVIAVEATPHNAQVAARNISLNHLEGTVTVVHAAAAASAGAVRFSASPNGHVGSTSYAYATIEVRAESIDTLADLYGRPDVVFIDVEGYELEVLRGGAEVLFSKPDLFIEVHAGVGLEEHGGSVAEIVDLVRTCGYSSLFVGDISGGEFVRLGVDCPSRHFYLVAVF
jgi:FkbM family methyltransferase